MRACMPSPCACRNLYTGRTTTEEEYEDLRDLISRGHAVDVKVEEDEEVRSWIKEILVAGCARIFETTPEEARIRT